MVCEAKINLLDAIFTCIIWLSLVPMLQILLVDWPFNRVTNQRTQNLSQRGVLKAASLVVSSESAQSDLSQLRSLMEKTKTKKMAAFVFHSKKWCYIGKLIDCQLDASLRN